MSTLKQLRQRVQDASNRTIGGSDTEVNALVNDAYAAAVRDMRTTFTSGAITLVAGQSDYSFVTLNLSVLDVKYIDFARNGLHNPLTPISFDDILAMRGLNTVTGGAAYYYSLVGLDFLSIYPVPQSGDTATLWYYSRPAVLSGDSDAVATAAVPVDWQDLIVLKALTMSARTLNKGKNAQGLQMAEQFNNDYKSLLADFKRYRNRAHGSRNRVISWGAPRRPRYSNDTYISPYGEG